MELRVYGCVTQTYEHTYSALVGYYNSFAKHCISETVLDYCK
jgi:hypothetical protein